MNFQPFLLLGMSITFTVTAHLLLKKGVTSIGGLEFSLANFFGLIFQIFQSIYLFLGLFFFGIAFLFWLFALSKIQLNIMYPIAVGLNFCLLIIIPGLLFKEHLSFYQIFGISIILFGIFLVLKP